MYPNVDESVARAGAEIPQAVKLRVAAATETSFATWIEVIDRRAPDGCLIRIPPPRHGPGETPAGGDYGARRRPFKLRMIKLRK